MLDRMDSASNAHSIETGAGPGTRRRTRPSRAELQGAHARAQARHTGAHRGSTAVGAQRGAAMHLPEKIGWQSSGAQLYPRPCRASLGRDSSSVQPPRTNPALASVSGASRRSRAAPGRRSLIIAAIASAAMAIAVTPPLGTVLVAHAGSVRGGRAELAGTEGPRRHRHRHCCHRSKRHVLRRRWWRLRGRRSLRRQRWRGRRPPPNSNHTLSRSHREWERPRERPSTYGQLQRPTHPISRSTRCAQGMEERGAARRMSGERAPTMEMASLNTLRIIIEPSPRGLAGSV